MGYSSFCSYFHYEVEIQGESLLPGFEILNSLLFFNGCTIVLALFNGCVQSTTPVHYSALSEVEEKVSQLSGFVSDNGQAEMVCSFRPEMRKKTAWVFVVFFFKDILWKGEKERLLEDSVVNLHWRTFDSLCGSFYAK